MGTSAHRLRFRNRENKEDEMDPAQLSSLSIFRLPFRYVGISELLAAIYLTFMVSVQNSSFISSSSKVEENEATTWMREAFMNGGSSKHFFTIYDGDNYLVWKRASDSPESRMRLRLGSFPMTEANDLDAARVEFMDCAVEAAAGKGGKDEALEARHDKLKEELRKCQEALKDMAESKEELETKLYEQFLPILQSKQDKIRELKGMGRVKKENDEDSYGSSTDVDEKTEEA